MKLTTFLLLAMFLQVSAGVFSQTNGRLNLKAERETVTQILKQIEDQTEFRFLYNSNNINVERKTDIDCKSKNIEEVLDLLFSGTNVKYRSFNSNYVLYTDEDAFTGSVQQQKTVSGKVTDSSGSSLPGVSVVVKGTINGTITDTNGNYSLSSVPGNASLQFSFIGMKTQEIAISGKTVIDITLEQETIGIDEVIAIGYGSQSKRNVTGSVETVNFSKLSEIPAGQITQKLQGQLAGVQINQTTGKPGQGMSVRIRGQASILAGSDPLYVVDGFPIVGDISSINPNEIESISVLKDAASTSLYGSRAANGVVLITTKSAKMGESNISISAYTGFQQVPQKGRPDMMNATEFGYFKKESYEDLGQTVPDIFKDPEKLGQGYDWYDAMLRVAPIHDYNVIINSKNEKFSVSVVGGYFSQDGVLLNSDYERFSFRSNVEYKLNDRVKAGFNVAPSYSINNTPNTDGLFFMGGGIINNALLTWPMLPYENEDGSLPLIAYLPGISAFPAPNWYRSLQEITNKTKTNRLLSNGFLELEVIDGLKLKSSINVEMGQSLFNNFNPSTASIGFASLPPITASALKSNNQFVTWLNENIATYKKSINDHNFELLVGYTAQQYKGEYSQIRTTNFPDDRISTIQSAINIDRPNTYSDIQEWSLVSYLSRLTYNYKGKYLLTGAIRLDGSSRFGSNNKWGNFPSVSAGWIVSDEKFMSDVKPISFFKLKASYGITGNNNIGNYTQYANVNNTTNTVFGSTVASGAAVVSLSNSDLGWETTSQLDIGFELGILENRVRLNYDYYSKKTTNLLYNLSVPRESGFSSITSNVGSLKFWGHEFSVYSDNLRGKLKWNTNFNIAFSDNKVLELSNLSDRIYGDWDRTITKVGGRIGQFYGLIWDGVYENQQDFDNSPKHTNSQVGTIKFRDTNGDKKITYGGDEDDRVIMGNPFPKFIYGLTNSFVYENFDLSIVASGSYGNKIASLMDEGTTNLDGVFNVLKEVKNRWRSEANPGDGRYGKTTAATDMERAWFNSRFVQDGSYLAIKNITLGYNVPVKNNNIVRSVRLYSSVQQAFVFTKYKGANPEVTTSPGGQPASALNQGMDYSAYPVPRTFTFGVNLQLK
ncbi:MAG TPA: TonB-dependent receptor [Prolixibacteraceae bacterium]|nr:TonB-dependent receptor [Prolixibacteraceae bacterium]